MTGLTRLAPAAAVVILLLATISGRNFSTGYTTGTEDAFSAFALSNHSIAWTYASADSCEHNLPPKVIFASTNSRRIPSSMGSFLPFGTNSLLH
jgi:hypothetical protein